MARWAVGWLLLILTATALVYSATSALIQAPPAADETSAFQPLGDLGSPACTRATRALLAAGDGEGPDATFAQLAVYERAALEVQQACGAA